jgi:transcriptional regulator with XRE-family HTH domain
MKKNLEDLYKEIDDFFSSPPTVGEKAWGIIHDFYHLALTYMEEKNITRADLARRLGKSRAAVSHMFNKTPNITVKKMIEIADAIGIDIHLTTRKIGKYHEPEKEYIFVPIHNHNIITAEKLGEKYKENLDIQDRSFEVTFKKYSGGKYYEDVPAS